MSRRCLQHLELKYALVSVQVARLCEAANVGHVINNAYGVQSTALCKLVRPPASSLFRRWDTHPAWLACGSMYRFQFSSLPDG